MSDPKGAQAASADFYKLVLLFETFSKLIFFI